MSLRIGLLCHSGYGGSVRAAVGLAEELVGRGHAVHLFARRAPLVDAVPRGVAFHALLARPAPDTPRLDVDWSAEETSEAARRIAAVSRQQRLDVLHFHYGIPFAWVSVEAVRQTGSPKPRLVGTLHGTDVSQYGLDERLGPMLDGALHHLDAVTTVSRSHAALVREIWLDRNPTVIPDFVDTVRFRPAQGVRRLGRRPRVVHVSNFRHVKNPQAVARIFVRLRRLIDAELWLVGDGEGMPEAGEILRAGGMEGDTRRFGFRPDVEAILPHADALLLASRTESFGLAALEAAACGVPVVAPRVGGLPEVILDGRTGILYDPGNEEAAVRALRRVLDPARRAEMGSRAVNWARRFAPAMVVPRYEALYRRVVRGEEVAAG